MHNRTLLSWIRGAPCGAALLLAFLTACAAPPTAEDEHRLAESEEVEQSLVRVAADARPAVVCVMFGFERDSMRGTGTGVIVKTENDEATVLTCGHVAKKPGRHCAVVLPDGRVFEGETVAALQDGAIDLGVIRFPTHGAAVPSVPLGNTAATKDGDWVVVLGHPRGLWIQEDDPDDPESNGWRNDMASMRMRLSSPEHPDVIRPAVVRTGRVWETPEGGLRFDAPLEAGDSGGPVLDRSGRVVSIASRCGWKSFWNWGTGIDILEGDPAHLVAAMEKHTETHDPDSEPGTGAGHYNTPALGKDHPHMLSAFRTIGHEAGRSVVEIEAEGGVRCLGIVVDSSGGVLTKASEVGFSSPLRVHHGLSSMRAVRAAWDADADLILLRAEGLDMPPISLGAAPVPEPGHFIISLGPDGEPLALGTVSLEAVKDEELDCRPFLGVSSTPARNGGFRVSQVNASTPAARAGLLANDLIISVDGAPIGRDHTLAASLIHRHAGDTVTLEVERGETKLGIPVVLDRRQPSIHVRDRGNTRSLCSAVTPRHTLIFRHDGDIAPDECGSPAVDIHGHVIGFNVARYDRTATLTIPVSELRQRVDALIAAERRGDSSKFERLAEASFAVTEDPRGRMRFLAADARLVGARELARAIGNAWAPDGSGLTVFSDERMQWVGRFDRPGKFEVIFEGSSKAERTIRLHVGDKVFEAEVPPGSHRRDDAVSLGEIDIPGTGRLTVDLEWKEALFDGFAAAVDRLELRRVNPGEDSKGGDG